jgi:hypothetical protein
MDVLVALGIGACLVVLLLWTSARWGRPRLYVGIPVGLVFALVAAIALLVVASR